MKKIYIFAVVTILLLSGCGQGLSPRTKFHIHEASKTASSMRDNWKAIRRLESIRCYLDIHYHSSCSPLTVLSSVSSESAKSLNASSCVSL